MWKQLSAGLSLVLLCGCFQTKDELTINADGSGKVHIETRLALPELGSELGATTMLGEGGGVMYPPVSESEAQKFFPARDFKVTTRQNRGTNGETTIIIEAEFKDINALLASAYGRAHQLSVRVENGSLVVKGLSGLEGAARMAEIKDESGMAGMMGGMAELQKFTNDMRGEFHLTLPNAVASTTGARQGKSASWIATRAESKDAEAFAQKLGAMCEARCSADGLTFAPVTPARLGLQAFAELTTGSTAAKGPPLDTNKIAAAVKFVPYGLSVSRSMDLSGQGNRFENRAELIGAVVVPPEFVPQKWGAPRLDEAVDAKGNNLKPADADDVFATARYRSMMNDEGDEDDANNAGGVRRVVSLGFRPPDWKVTEIARIKGSIALQYFGGSQSVVKLTNAIPGNWMINMSKMMQGSFDSGSKLLSSPELSNLGLSMTVDTCLQQNGVTMLSFEVAGAAAALTDVQVFDAAGRPWPTMVVQGGMGADGSCNIIVPGNPQPPLSLAVLANGGGTSIDVPIVVEHVTTKDK